LRFFIIHDRWTASDELHDLKSRTIDELKDRYYKEIRTQLHKYIDNINNKLSMI
jgi:hypothetical protein